MIDKQEEMVFQALGEASLCWNPKPSGQVFDSDECKKIGERLIRSLSQPN